MGDVITISTLTVEEAKELASLRMVKAVFRGGTLRIDLERRYRVLSLRGTIADRFRVAQ